MPRARRATDADSPSKPLPLRTPISALGLTPAQAKRLTPAARKLTKGDLLAMMEGKTPRAAQALTLRDLSSINQVYATALRARLPPLTCCCCCAGGGCCCCCETLTIG